MKKIIILLLIPLLLACSKDDKEEPIHFQLSASSLNFEKEGGSQTVNVYSNGYWNLTYSGGGWCTVSPSSGNGDATIQITATDNTSNMRSQSVSFSYGSLQATLGTGSLSISQAGSTTSGGQISAPTGVTANKIGTTIWVSWNAVSGASNYYVYRSSSASGTYSLITTTVSSSATDQSPLSGDNYYKIKTSSGTTMNDYSSYAYVNFSSGGSGTLPAAPTGVTVSNLGNEIIPDIRVSWNSVSNATSYKVYRSSSASGTYSLMGSISTSTTLRDASPMTGNNYYKVTAINSSGESDYSSYTSYNYDPNDVSPCPPLLTGTKVGTSSIKISWTYSTSSGCGKPTSFEFKGYNPQFKTWVVLATSGTSYTVVPMFDTYGISHYGISVTNSKGSASKTISYDGSKFY